MEIHQNTSEINTDNGSIPPSENTIDTTDDNLKTPNENINPEQTTDEKKPGDNNQVKKNIITFNGFNVGRDFNIIERGDNLQDPTEATPEETISSKLSFEMDAKMQIFEDTLKEGYLLAVRCADEDIHREIVARFAKSNFFNRIPNISFRDYFVERQLQNGQSASLTSLYNAISHNTVDKGNPSVIFIYETEQGLGKSNGKPVFLTSLLGSRASVQSFKHHLSQKQVYLVYFFYTHDNEVEKLTESWYWPQIQSLTPLKYHLQYYFPSRVTIEEYESEVLLQRGLGLWPKSEYEFIENIKKHLAANEFETVLRNFKTTRSDENQLPKYKAEEEECQNILSKTYLNRVVLFVAAYFHGIGLGEFRNLIEALVTDTILQPEGGNQISEQDLKKLENWRKKSDMVLVECGLTTHETKEYLSIIFKKEYHQDIFKQLLKSHFPQFLQEQGEKLLDKGFFFSQNVSETFISGMGIIFQQLALANPNLFIKNSLEKLALQLEECGKPLHESYQELEERKTEWDKLLYHIQHFKNQHEKRYARALQLLIQKLESGEMPDYEKLIEYVDSIDVNIEGQEVRIVQDDLIKKAEILKDKVKERFERVKNIHLIRLSEWLKLMKRYARLLVMLYEDKRFEKEITTFIDFWQSTGKRMETLITILEHLHTDYNFNALHWFRKILQSPEKHFQSMAYAKIIRTVAKNPFGFKGLRQTLQEWIETGENNKDTAVSQFARVFLFEYLKYFELENEEYGIITYEINPVEISPEEYGKWPSAYPFFAALTDSENLQIEWEELMDWLFSKELEEAFLSIFYRFNPGAKNMDKDLSDYFINRVAASIENWLMILTGEEDKTEHNPGWQRWNMAINVISNKTSAKQKTGLLKYWRKAQSDCGQTMALIWGSKLVQTQKDEKLKKVLKRRDRLKMLHEQFSWLTKKSTPSKKSILRFDD